MPEHLIQLRRAWDGHFDEGEGEGGSGGPPARRVDLPTEWSAGVVAPFRLVRAFNRPAIDPARESIMLRLEAVPGLRSVGLNGRELARPDLGTDALEIPIGGHLAAKNRLVLEVDPTGWSSRGSAWGRIALAIRSG